MSPCKLQVNSSNSSRSERHGAIISQLQLGGADKEGRKMESDHRTDDCGCGSSLWPKKKEKKKSAFASSCKATIYEKRQKEQQQ